MLTFAKIVIAAFLIFIVVKWTIELVKDVKKKKQEKKAKVEELEKVVSDSESASDVDKKI